MNTTTVLLADMLVFPIIVIGATALLVYVPRAKKYATYCRVVMAGLTAFLVGKLVAMLYQPSLARPFEILGVQPGASYLDNPGFPSDHALFVWAIVFAVAFEVRKPWLTGTLAVMALLVCVGRVIALVHTPFDIVGGVLAAALGAVWYLQRFTERKILANK